MPRFTFWAVRLSLIYLLLGFSLGALLLANKGILIAAWIWKLLPLHIEFLLFGFISQLVMGIAFWILPRFSGGSRGNEKNYWVSIIFMNLGVWMVGGEGGFGQPGWLLLVGRVFEGIAALLFILNSWLRVKPLFPNK
jgi:hypothetical protein